MNNQNYFNQILEKLDKIESMLQSQSFKILTMTEACEYLQLSRSRLYHLSSSRLIPCYKPGGKILYFNKSELDEWVLKGKVKTAEEIDEIADEYIISHRRKY